MTKTFDSTVSQLLQDNSAVEYVAPEKNPICKKQSDNSLFNFHAEHNGEACIESLRPEDRGTERQFWFTVAMLCVIYGVARKTLEDNIQSLLEDGELSMADFRRTEKVPASDGKFYETAIYNLEVLNKLGMCCFRGNKKAKEIRNKFNDVLVKHETQNQPVMLPNFCSPAEAARAWADLYEKNQAIEHRALTAESERDEAIRTKTQYQSNLAAQMSGRVGGLTTALNRVKLENDRLKGDRLTKDDVYIIMQTQGVSFTLKTVKDVIRDALNTISEYLDEPFPKIKTGEHTDSDGKTFEVKSFVYTRKTVKAFFEYVENNPLGWQARNRKFILGEWLNHGMTIPV